MNAERYTIEPRVGADNYDDVVKVDQADLPAGVDAVLLIRSNLNRQQVHAVLIHAQNHIVEHTWPESDAAGGDKEGERLLKLANEKLQQAAQLRGEGKAKDADIAEAEGKLLRAKSGL